MAGLKLPRDWSAAPWSPKKNPADGLDGVGRREAGANGAYFFAALALASVTAACAAARRATGTRNGEQLT